MYVRILRPLHDSKARRQAGTDRQLPLGRGREAFFLSYLQTNDEGDERRDDLMTASSDTIARSTGKRTGVDFLHTHHIHEIGTALQASFFSLQGPVPAKASAPNGGLK